MNTLVVSSLYTRDQPITTCAPKSLQGWFKANNVEHKQPKDCEVKIQEVDSGRSDYIELQNMMENSTIFLANTGRICTESAGKNEPSQLDMKSMEST